MLRFIFLCIAIIAISFTAIPMLMNISQERNTLLNNKPTESSVFVDSDLSFEEIYALANANIAIDPAMLNAIAPAAGNTEQNNSFSSGFSGKEDRALAE